MMKGPPPTSSKYTFKPGAPAPAPAKKKKSATPSGKSAGTLPLAHATGGAPTQPPGLAPPRPGGATAPAAGKRKAESTLAATESAPVAKQARCNGADAGAIVLAASGGGSPGAATAATATTAATAATTLGEGNSAVTLESYMKQDDKAKQAELIGHLYILMNKQDERMGKMITDVHTRIFESNNAAAERLRKLSVESAKKEARMEAQIEKQQQQLQQQYEELQKFRATHEAFKKTANVMFAGDAEKLREFFKTYQAIADKGIADLIARKPANHQQAQQAQRQQQQAQQQQQQQAQQSQQRSADALSKKRKANPMHARDKAYAQAQATAQAQREEEAQPQPQPQPEASTSAPLQEADKAEETEEEEECDEQPGCGFDYPQPNTDNLSEDDDAFQYADAEAYAQEHEEEQEAEDAEEEEE